MARKMRDLSMDSKDMRSRIKPKSKPAPLKTRLYPRGHFVSVMAPSEASPKGWPPRQELIES